MNPFKLIGKGIYEGLKGAGKGVRYAYRKVTHPNVLAVLRVGGLVIPGLNALGVLSFLEMAKEAERSFPSKGSGGQKLRHVLESAITMRGQLKKWGVPEQEWEDYIEVALLVMKGQAALVHEVTGDVLLETDMERLKELFDA